MKRTNIKQIKTTLNLTILANYGPIDQAVVMPGALLLVNYGDIEE